MNEYYKLKLLGIERDLPILKSPSGLYIAGFNPVGDMELLLKSAKYLKKAIKRNKIKYDMILTTEFKGLPIAQEVAKLLKCDYLCLRKSAKCYMKNPMKLSGESITSGKSTYYISEDEVEKIKNKKVIFVDDVFSTGATFDSMLNFSKQCDFELVGGASILKEDFTTFKKAKNNVFNYKGLPIIYCGFLPLQKEEEREK